MKFLAIAAMTLDGKIAKNKDHLSTDWTSKEDRIFMRALLDKCDVIIVGNNTYKTAIKPLSKRNCIVFTKQVPSPGEGMVRPARQRLEPKATAGGERSNNGVYRKSENLLYVNPTKVDVKKLITKLGYQKAAILGGAQTYTYCLQNNMMDELYLTVEPTVFGKGIDLFSPSKFSGALFKLISIKKLNAQGSLLLRYKK